jgi:hypothetical protein
MPELVSRAYLFKLKARILSRVVSKKMNKWATYEDAFAPDFGIPEFVEEIERQTGRSVGDSKIFIINKAIGRMGVMELGLTSARDFVSRYMMSLTTQTLLNIVSGVVEGLYIMGTKLDLRHNDLNANNVLIVLRDGSDINTAFPLIADFGRSHKLLMGALDTGDLYEFFLGLIPLMHHQRHGRYLVDYHPAFVEIIDDIVHKNELMQLEQFRTEWEEIEISILDKATDAELRGRPLTGLEEDKPTYTIFVEFPDGERLEVGSVHPKLSVGMLKLEIADMLSDVTEDSFELSYRGVVIWDEARTIVDVGVEDGDTVDLSWNIESDSDSTSGTSSSALRFAKGYV